MPESLPSTETPEFLALMQQGSQLHQQGQLPQALMAFEQALQAAPGNLDASCATGTLLSLLGRPAAAYRVLMAVEAGLMETADGAANLAIAAENCGDIPKAHKAYERALQLDPQNLRALTNVGLIAAGLAQWDMAIACARKCVTLQPAELSYWQTLSDTFTSARRYAEALQVLDEADKSFPAYLDLKVRRITVLAFSGNFEVSMALEASLDASGKTHLREFLSQALHRPAASFFEQQPHDVPFSPTQLFCVQAFAAMAECDWRNNDMLSRMMREAISAHHPGNSFAWGKDSQFYALTLDLDEVELAQVQRDSLAAANKGGETLAPPFSAKTRVTGSPKDGRIHVGFAIQEPGQIPALKKHLSVCDHERFSFHVYSFARPPEPYVQDVLQPLPTTLVEMAHMTDAEAVGRIRLDGLDIYVDTAPDARWHRPRIAGARVARVQLLQHSWIAGLPPGTWDYTMSDTFVQPEGCDMERQGALVRLPTTCWLATHAEQAGDARPTRESAGLPADTLVLCSAASPASLDAFSFSQWMKILRSLPDAILWLPACNATAAAHLVREAGAQGVHAERLLFSPPLPASDVLAGLAHADLVLDTLRVNQPQGVEDALRLGVPAITCAGISMAARLGGSILNAAGLPELITASPQDYVAEVVRLGRSPQAMLALRKRIQASQADAPLFKLVPRVRQWETAWATMTERSRSGLQPAAFAVAATYPL